MWVETKEPYIFPKHHNQVLFYLNVLDGDLWFVLRHYPRSKHLFENKNVIIPSEEDNQGDGNEELYVNILFQHLYCGCLILLWLSIIGQYIFFLHFMMLDMKS